MRKTLDESKMKRNGKIEEIRKNPYNPRNSFFFKLEEYYYRPIKVVILLVLITLNIIVMEIKIKLYYLKSILIRLNHI